MVNSSGKKSQRKSSGSNKKTIAATYLTPDSASDAMPEYSSNNHLTPFALEARHHLASPTSADNTPKVKQSNTKKNSNITDLSVSLSSPKDFIMISERTSPDTPINYQSQPRQLPHAFSPVDLISSNSCRYDADLISPVENKTNNNFLVFDRVRRRSSAQVNYKEPSLTSKVRKGHVFFSKSILSSQPQIQIR